ncbi:MAG: PGF-CTERM sorting domain-containing protein, partial [Methanothrix sp.]
MLLTAAMVVSASEKAAEETMEKNVSTTEHATEEVKETENKTAEPAKEQPGFEGVFAIAGLLAVASLVLSKRE